MECPGEVQIIGADVGGVSTLGFRLEEVEALGKDLNKD